MIYLLSVLLGVSLFLNVGLVWYVRELLKVFNMSSANFKQMKNNTESFQNQLEQIYESERYFGEPRLENLLEECKIFGEQIENIVQIYNLDEKP